MKYLKVFEDFIEQEEIKKLKNQDEEELPIETIQDEGEIQDENEKEDLLEEIKRYYIKKNKRK